MMRRSILDLIDRDPEKLNLGMMQEMQDWQVDAALSNSGGKSQDLFEKIFLRELHKTAVVFKVEGYGYAERTGGKDITVIEITEDQARKLPSETKELRRMIALESNLSKALNTDAIMVATPNMERISPQDPKVYSIDREEVTKLSQINPGFHAYQLEVPKYTWSLRIAVPEKDRRRMSEMGNLIKHELYLD